MPSRSAAEHRFWGAMKSHPDEAKAKGIRPSTVNEFLQADRGRHFRDTPTVKPRFMRRTHG